MSDPLYLLGCLVGILVICSAVSWHIGKAIATYRNKKDDEKAREIS